MYPGIITSKNQEQIIENPNLKEKVNHLCTSVIKALDELDSRKFLNSTLTAYARMTPPALESAMIRIRQVREQDGSEAAEAALQHLVFLVNAEQLYNVALGLYDFSLVLLAAQQSQMVIVTSEIPESNS